MIEKNKKIIVLDSRMIHMSGIGRYIQALIPALIENALKLILLAKEQDIKEFPWAQQVEVVEIVSPIYSINEQVDIFFKTPKCDVFIAPHYNCPIWLPQAKKIAVIIPDANHLVFANEMSYIKRIYAKLFFSISVKKDLIFTISDFSKSEIVKFTNVNPQKIIVAKCSINKEYFSSIDKDIETNILHGEFDRYTNENYLLFTGNIKPHKNIRRTLLAFKEVIKMYPDLKFIIVGKKDNFLNGDSSVFDIVKLDDSLSKSVVFTGRISDLQLAFLYKNAKIFLFPSLYEGFGIPPLEAMFFKCPVIVSREASLPEICKDAAYYCDAYNVDDISRAIIDLLSNDLLRISLVKKGLLNLENYDWNIFNKIIIDKLNLNDVPLY